MKITAEFRKYLPIMALIVFTLLFIELIENFDFLFEKASVLLDLIKPFVYSFIIAYVLNPIVKIFERIYGGKRTASVLSTYITLIALIVMIAIYIFPKIWANIYELYIDFPMIVESVRQWSIEFSQHEKVKGIFQLLGISQIRADIIFLKLSEYVQSYSAYMLRATVLTTLAIAKWMFALLVSIYVLIYKDLFKGFFIKISLKIFGKRKCRKFFRLSRTIHKMIGIYIGTKAIDSMIIGSIALVGLYAMNSPVAFLLAFIVFATNMIPYFGPLVGMLVAATVHLFYSPQLALTSLVYLFLVQQFDAWFLDPKMIGNKVGINPFLVIFAVTIAGGIYGPIGMLLATPVMGTIKIYVDIFLKRNKTIPR